jgi:hypothetical protein
MVCYSLDGGDVYGPQTAGIWGTSEAQYPVMAVDSLDRPYVAMQGYGGIPELARFDIASGQWIVETVPGSELVGAYGRVMTVGVNGQDHPVVAYFGYYEGGEAIIVATLADGGWALRGYDPAASGFSGPAAYGGISLAFDSTDAPHVAFVTQGNELVVLRFNLLSVTGQVAVAGMPIRIGPHAMAIDSGDRIRIAFSNPADGSLHFANNDVGWSTHLVDTAASDARGSLALDSQGRWVIAYLDSTDQVVKVAGPTVPSHAPGDCDCDGDVDLGDYTDFEACFQGPGGGLPVPECACFDLDGSGDVDLRDFGVFQLSFSGSS